MYKWKELIVAHWIKLSLQLSLEISHLTWPTHLSSRGGAKVTASEKWSQERGYIVTFFIWLGNSYMGISARRSNSVRSEQEKQTGRGESEWGGGGDIAEKRGNEEWNERVTPSSHYQLPTRSSQCSFPGNRVAPEESIACGSNNLLR